MPTTLGENLKRLREQRDLTQEDVSARSGLPQSQISKYETGKDIPQPANLLRHTVGLGRTLDEIVSGLDADYDAIVAAHHKKIQTEHVQNKLDGATSPVTPPVVNTADKTQPSDDQGEATRDTDPARLVSEFRTDIQEIRDQVRLIADRFTDADADAILAEYRASQRRKKRRKTRAAAGDKAGVRGAAR